MRENASASTSEVGDDKDIASDVGTAKSNDNQNSSEENTNSATEDDDSAPAPAVKTVCTLYMCS